MILRDEVDVYRVLRTDEVFNDDTGEYETTEVRANYGTLRAHVGSTTGSAVNGDRFGSGLGWLEQGEAVALIRPHDGIEDASTTGAIESVRVVWRGRTYVTQAALPTARDGRTHHLTLKLKRVT